MTDHTSSTQASLTGASAPLEIGDHEYQASPLTDKDISELDAWIQADYVKVARASLDENSTKAEREETLAIAMRQAAGLSWMSGTGAKMIATVKGMARLTWQMIHRNHPKVTVAQLQSELFNPENLANAKRIFDKLNLPPEDEDDSDDAKKNARRKARQKAAKKKAAAKKKKKATRKRR